MENNFRLEDLILNESFRDYVLETDKNAADFWNNWIAAHPENKQEFDKAIMVLKVLLHARKRPVPIDKNESLKILLDNVKSEDRYARPLEKSFFKSPWLRVAAIILIIVLLSIVWKIRNHSTMVKDIAYNEIIVPVGEKAQVILADSSHIWINSGSRFKYPVNFGNQNREVFLEGEAYFDVTKQRGKLFIVNTKDIKVKVLGTAFNVKNYPLDKTIETTVVRGLVKVESALARQNSVFVNPNEIAVYVKESKQLEISSSSSAKSDDKNLVETAIKPIVISKINPEVVTCWKDQKLIFTDETLEDMVIKMERWYNIKIRINDSTLRNERYNGKFVHNETIYQVLEAIKLTTPITFGVIDNNIIITRKQKT